MSTATAPKTQLGRYELVRHLASGGMADLWLARATGIEGFEHHVALKRIRKEQARDQRFVQMFLDEARLAASLHHHNIATVHDIGQTQGEYFFAMEWVHGEDLRKILMLANAREQSVPIEHVMSIALATSAALHYAHEHKSQIVHRDVSPANILVGYDGNVKVIDFGIAKAAHRTKETQSGVMKGKVAYMSPEQCVGQPVDRRSDLFSLGIVLYELLTVRRLFKAANDFLTMSAIIHGAIPPPSTIRPGVPRELEAIVMKALSPERGDRFRTAEELRRALERFCTSNHIRTSATLLAEYMRSQFGHKPEPWLADAEPELDLTIDFDGTMPGIVRVPEAALKRYAVPATTPVQPSAPIMKARTKAITGAPPLDATPAGALPTVAAADEATEIVAPLPLDLLEAERRVGDDTQLVRPATSTARTGTHVALVVLVVAGALAAAVFVIQRLNAGDDADPRQQANPNIKLPPPSSPTLAAPPIVTPADAAAVAATPDAAEEITSDAPDEVTPDADEAAGSGPHEPGTLVRLREDDPAPGSATVTKKRLEKVRRRPRGAPQPPPDDSTDGSWDPNTLFPEN